MKNKLFLISLILLLCLGVGIIASYTYPNPEKILSVTVTDPAEDLEYLDKYTSLQFVDMTGYSNYDQILTYVASHPNVEVNYNVLIGSQSYSCDTTQLVLESGSFQFDQLITNLKYLPDVTHISFPETDLTLEDIQNLKEMYQGITVDYTVNFNGEILDPDITELNLSDVPADQIIKNLDKLTLLPALKDINLSDDEGNSDLSVAEVKVLQDAFPDVFFHYSFDLFGKTVSTSDEVIEYNEVPIGNEGESDIRAALDILTNCTYFKLDDCGLDNEVMAGIREDYPDVKVVWRVHIEPFSMLTDETMLRLTFHLNDSNIENLKYLNDVTYLDVGHNETLSDISFVQYMPKLECVIVSGSLVSDISYFENCKELIWLELCFCYRLEDISVLKDHPTLKYLNVSFSMVSDLSALENVKLDRFNCMQTYVNWEQETAFKASHPDCLSIFTGKQPYGYGWRYNDYGYTFFEYYANMRVVFRYDETGYWGNHKED